MVDKSQDYKNQIKAIIIGKKKSKRRTDMDKFIPINKKSKKAQKEYYAKRRSTWGTLNPVTRTVPNGKKYDRNKLKQEDKKKGRMSQETGTFRLSFYLDVFDANFS